MTARVLMLVVCAVVLALPLGWVVVVIAGEPGSFGGAFADPFQWGLLGRTLLYNTSAAMVAGLLGLPAAYVIGRGRGASRALLLAAAPACLVVPSLVYAYGFQQALRLIGVSLEPGGGADVVRCVLTLGAWLWGVTALGVGLAWRRLDTSIEQQARLDGAGARITARLLATPLLACVLVAAALATQEFGVYEPTGISVTATEARMVFETGAFSSAGNPMTQALGGGVATSDQAARAAASLRTALPALLATLALAGAAALLARRLAYKPAEAPDPAPPRALGPLPHLLAWAVVLLALGVPVVAMALSLRDHSSPWQVAQAFMPQLGGSLLLAGMTLAGTLGLAALACAAKPPSWLIGAAVTLFLLGGLPLGVALIRIYNRDATAWVYDGPAIALLAYLGRFGFLALIAGAATWSPAATRLREMARADCASAWAVAWRVAIPAAWPGLVAAAVGAALLSLGEVPATVLVAPQRPPLLTPLLMTWVHMQRYDPMIQASLLLAGLTVAGSLAATLLLVWARGCGTESHGAERKEEAKAVARINTD